MNPSLLGRLACPRCRSVELSIAEAIEKAGEIESGTIRCGCGARYAIDRFVPSFFDSATNTPADERMLADGRYWSEFYNYYEDAGYRYYLDSRTEVAPLLFQGILRTIRLNGRWSRYAHWHEPHYRDFFGPLLETVPPGGVALELGSGAGWLTVELARRGLRAVGQDTALEALVRAKRYAMQQGLDVEYLHASSLALPLRPESFDAFTAFQALHHFESLQATLERANEALRPGGRVLIFEHRRSRPPKLGKIAAAFDRLCLPVLRRLYPPTAKADWVASPSEDTATGHMDDLIRCAFAIEREQSYSLFLQQLPVYAYFLLGESRLAYVACSVAVNTLDRAIADRFADKCEHRTYVGTRRS